jgi:hypothetical protein
MRTGPQQEDRDKAYTLRLLQIDGIGNCSIELRTRDASDWQIDIGDFRSAIVNTATYLSSIAQSKTLM